MHRRRSALCTLATVNAATGVDAHTLYNPPSVAQRAAQSLGGFVELVGGTTAAVGRSASETARAARFWSTVLAIWGRYKMTQMRAAAALARGDTEKQHELWQRRHEAEAETMWNLCVSMRGFFVKAGQLITLQAFVPTVIRQRLAQLQDDMPPMDSTIARGVIEEELETLGFKISDVFASLSLYNVLGSASIAQVHRGRLRDSLGGCPVAVKIQYPQGERRMKHDLGNFQFLASLLQRTEFAFDLVSPVTELRRQIVREFDFIQEANAMQTIGNALGGIRDVQIPKPFKQFSTKRMLVMQFVDGTPLSKIEAKLAHLPERTRTKVARIVLKKMAKAYGEMVLTHGMFQADCHPGNVLVTNRNADIALLDFGQTKLFDLRSRIEFANMVCATAKEDPVEIERAMQRLGINMEQMPMEEGTFRPRPRPDLTGAQMLAYTMFDTRKVDGVSNNPFADDSALRVVQVDAFPPNLFFLLRTVQIFKGICDATGNSDFSIIKHWDPIAKKALRQARRNKNTIVVP